MDASKLAGWVPINIGWRTTGPFADWCHVGDARFTEPFFEHTIERLLRNPATLVFRHETPLDVLADWPATEPGGFIFHMSRCGSTLLGRMLAASPRNIVISEAPPVDAILRANQWDPDADDTRRIAWLRGLLGAYARPGCRVFVKFDGWHAVDLPLIRHAFPATPWIFLARNPIEVLVSQLRQRGALMVPGMVNFTLPGVDLAAAMAMPPAEYCSRVLGSICEAAADAAQDGGGKVIDYADLPDAFFSEIAPAFGISFTPEERAAVLAVTQFDAKSPALGFESDAAGKQRDATDAMREAVARWIAPHYERLRAIRPRRSKTATQ